MLGDFVAADIMTQGLHIKFHSIPPLSLLPPPEAITNVKQTKIIETFIPGWIKRDIIREILIPQPLYFSRMFSVLKKNGKVRPIIDLSALNKMLCIPSFRMETVDSICKTIVFAMWGTSLDITDAYLHVPLHWDIHKYFAFSLGQRIFVFQVLE